MRALQQAAVVTNGSAERTVVTGEQESKKEVSP